MKEYQKLSIVLSPEERKELQDVVKKGKSSAALIRRANVILMADSSEGEKKTDEEIASSLNITRQTVHNIKVKYLSGVKDRHATEKIERKKRETPPVEPKFDGEKEAKIIALACSTPPEGRSKWTLRLLSERSVKLEIVPSISHTQVGRILKKTNLSLT